MSQTPCVDTCDYAGCMIFPIEAGSLSICAHGKAGGVHESELKGVGEGKGVRI